MVVQGATIVEAYDYDPWGVRLEGRILAGPTKEGFTTKERDAETGLDYFGARYYMAALGRWTSVDPLVDDFPEWSGYNYVKNDPMLRIDVLGMMDCSLSNFRGCRIGSLKGGVGLKGFGGAFALGPVRGGVKFLSVGGEASATASGIGVEAEAKGELTIVSGNAEVGSIGVKGSITCSAGTGGAECSKSGAVGAKAVGLDISNTTVGGEVSLGAVTIGLGVDVKQAGTLVLGAVLDLLSRVSKGATHLITKPVEPGTVTIKVQEDRDEGR